MLRNAFLSGFAWLGFAVTAQAITADELVAKNIDAHGGMAHIQAIKTLKFEGKLVFDGGVELAYINLRKAPDKVRNEGTMQGLTAVQAYDGKDAWQIQPFGGRKDPERLSADDAKPLANGADLVNGLVDAKSRGDRVEYQGTEDVDGTDAYKLKLTRKNGAVTYYFLDPDYFLEVRSLDSLVLRGVSVETETDYGDYEKVDGVYLPFSTASGAKGSPQKQRLVVNKAQANVPLDDAQFAFPAVTK